MEKHLDLAFSWLRDFDAHFNGSIKGKTAEDNIAVCVRLLQSAEADRYFNAEFLKQLRSHVVAKRTALIKEAEGKIALMKLDI